MFTKQADVDALVRIFRTVPGDILEIGCNRGMTTKALAEVFPDRIVHGVDCVRAPMCRQQQGEELTEAGQIGEAAVGMANVKIWRGMSPAVLRRVAQWLRGVRCVFIDGDHRESAVALDTMWALGQLPRGEGVIAWHDWYEGAPEWCGVERAVKAMAGMHESPLKGWKHEAGTWVGWCKV